MLFLLNYERLSPINFMKTNLVSGDYREENRNI